MDAMSLSHHASHQKASPSLLITTCFCLLICVSSVSWSTEELIQYDNLRFSKPEALNAETRDNSYVTRLTSPSPPSTNMQALQEISTTEESMRLCHIASLVPSTARGNRPSYGLPCEAGMTLGMLHFNDRIDEIVPELSETRFQDCNMKLDIEFFDSKMLAGVASRTLFDEILVRNHSLATPRPCALIGAARSAVSAQVSVLASMFGMPTISPYSLSPELDNEDMYKLFGRTVPSDAGMAMAALNYFKEMYGVTHCGILYVNDSYGRAFNRVFTKTARTATDTTVTVVSASVAPHAGEASIKLALRQLQATGFNYFVAAVAPQDHHLVVKVGGNLGLIGPGRYWLFSSSSTEILSDGFHYDANSQMDVARATDALAVIGANLPKNRAFSHAWRNMNSDLKNYVLSKQPKHVNTTGYDFPHTATQFYHFCFDAVVAVGIASCETDQEFFDGESLYDSFKDVNFSGASGKVRIDKDTGSRDSNLMGFAITHVTATPPDEHGKIFLDKTVVAKQQEGKAGMFWIFANSTTIFSDGSSTAPPDLPPATINPNYIRTSVRVFCLTVAGILMFSSIFWIIWTLKFRRSSVVKSSQPALLIVLCVGTFLMSSAVIPLSLQENLVKSERTLSYACKIAPWLFEIGFLASISALASKMAVINLLMERPRGVRRIKLNTLRVMGPFLFLGTIGLFVLALWTALAPLEWCRKEFSPDVYGRNSQSYGYCFGRHGRAFLIAVGVLNIVLLVSATVGAYRSQTLCSRYNESKYILLSFASLLQASLLGIPVLVLMSKHPTASFVTISMLIASLCAFILFPMFLPKEMSRQEDVATIQEQYLSSITTDNKSVSKSRPPTWTTIVREVQAKSSDATPSVWESNIYQAQRDSTVLCDSFNQGIRWQPGLDDLAL